MSSSDDVPFFRGLSVKRISVEPTGVTLWIMSRSTGEVECYLRADAEKFHATLPDGALRNELSDALRLCLERYGPALQTRTSPLADVPSQVDPVPQATVSGSLGR